MCERKLPQRVVGFQLSYGHTFEFSAPIGILTEGAHFALPFFVVARPRFRCLTISSWVLGFALSMHLRSSSPRCGLTSVGSSFGAFAMAHHLNIYFDDFPREADLIGVILIGFAELEFELAALVGYTFNSEDKGVRILFRLRSESQRLDVADAILRPKCAELKLEGAYSTTLGAYRWCKAVRNQYAHSHWIANPQRELCFFDLEEAAKSPEGPVLCQLKPVDADLLERQVEYFRHTARCLTYLSDEYRLRAKQISNHKSAMPKAMKQPKKHSLES